MAIFPPVNIGVITYNRPNEIRLTLTSLLNHIRYSGEVTIIVADDSSPGEYREDLMRWWQDQKTSWRMQIAKTHRNLGWGGNANNLLRHAFHTAPYLYFTEDDYLLTTRLDLDVGVALMENEPGLGLLRYRATAGTPLVYVGHETNISNLMPDFREYEGYGVGKVQWLELDGRSNSLWLYSNGPHLKRAQFHEVYGLYPEGLKLGQTEESYAHMVIDRVRTAALAPKLGIMPDWIHMKFQHIGISYQGTVHDK